MTMIGTRAVLTGATGGIGPAIATALARAGCDLVFTGLGGDDEIEAQRAGLAAEFGVKVHYREADLRRTADVVDFVRWGEDKLGGIDILCNNAGVLLKPHNIEDTPLDLWNDSFAVNVSAPFHAIRTALPGMRARGTGRIVNTGSVQGLVASPGAGAYTASKHGVIGLTKAVALELAETDITCNAVCPGLVATPMIVGRIEAGAAKRGISVAEMERQVVAARQGKLVPIEQIAAYVVFLCTEAAGSINGAALTIDSALTVR